MHVYRRFNRPVDLLYAYVHRAPYGRYLRQNGEGNLPRLGAPGCKTWNSCKCRLRGGARFVSSSERALD